MTLINTYTAQILLVDDKPANISLLTSILQEQGHQILAANNGEQAIKIATHILPDLILLDIMMPGIDGFETCRRLKNQPRTQSIPIIFISAKNEVEDVLMGFSVGGVDYINKPFYAEEVCSRVKNHLKIQKLHKDLLTSEAKMSHLLANYQHQSERLQQIVDHVTNGIVEIDHSGQIIFSNPAVEKLFGYTEEELLNINFFEFLVEPFAQLYQKKIAVHIESRDEEGFLDETLVEIQARRKDGSLFPIDFSLVKIAMAKDVYMAVIHDVTAHKEREEKLRYLSNIDPLTKLVNRRYFDQQFKKEWQRNQRGKSNENQMAFFMIDIDFFKPFNDTYGHQAGDVCLVDVANSIVSHTRRSSDFVARLGGEEFGVIITETSRQGVIQISEQIRSAVETLNILHSGSEQGIVTISLGGVIINGECGSAEDLYKKADQLMYQAKESGRNKCIVV